MLVFLKASYTFTSENNPATLKIFVRLSTYKSHHIWLVIHQFHASILKNKWNFPHANNMAKNGIVLWKSKKKLLTFCITYYEPKWPTLNFFIRKRKLRALLCFWREEKKNTKTMNLKLNWNRKTFTKQENLRSLVCFHDYRSKMIGEAYLLVLQQS